MKAQDRGQQGPLTGRQPADGWDVKLRRGIASRNLDRESEGGRGFCYCGLQAGLAALAVAENKRLNWGCRSESNMHEALVQSPERHKARRVGTCLQSIYSLRRGKQDVQGRPLLFVQMESSLGYMRPLGKDA